MHSVQFEWILYAQIHVEYNTVSFGWREVEITNLRYNLGKTASLFGYINEPADVVGSRLNTLLYVVVANYMCLMIRLSISFKSE